MELVLEEVLIQVLVLEEALIQVLVLEEALIQVLALRLVVVPLEVSQCRMVEVGDTALVEDNMLEDHEDDTLLEEELKWVER